ncbi:hypothetical protein ACFV1T_29075, partial [Streptomyces vinaceus]
MVRDRRRLLAWLLAGLVLAFVLALYDADRAGVSERPSAGPCPDSALQCPGGGPRPGPGPTPSPSADPSADPSASGGPSPSAATAAPSGTPSPGTGPAPAGGPCAAPGACGFPHARTTGPRSA